MEKYYDYKNDLQKVNETYQWCEKDDNKEQFKRLKEN